MSCCAGSSPPGDSLQHYADALKWNDANENARQLAAEARKQNFHQRLGEAVKLVDAKQFSEAFAALDRIGEVDDEESGNTVRDARAAVCFRHAMALAEGGHFRQALARAREGAALAPGQEAFRTLVSQLEGLAPDEDDLRHLKTAKEAMDKGRFDDVIAHAAKVGNESKYAGQGRSLHSAAYFRRGIAAAERENFSNALSDLRQALTLNGDPKEQAIIRKQIAALEQAEIGSGLKSAFEKRDWVAAESHLRDALWKGDPSRKVKKALQRQLSMVLNAAAVELADRAQKVTDEDVAKFDAITESLWISQFLTTSGSKTGMRKTMLLEAVKKLKEAIELDASNSAAKQNLQAVESLATRLGESL
jgi:tetratricopeptide (TPR) repeat protein